MRIDGKEILTDKELDLIINRKKSDAVRDVRNRLCTTLIQAARIVGTTMEELGIGRLTDKSPMPVYNDELPIMPPVKESNWDKEVNKELLDKGLTVEQAGMVIGIVAEHRQIADRQGYARGYNNGYAEAVKKG